jgi:cysteine desulfurase family protein (TIGR01976 family)
MAARSGCGSVFSMSAAFDPAAVRRHFPGLLRRIGSEQALFLDGPAGSQVPRAVADAMAEYLLHHNANHGGPFATSRETDAMVERARGAFADLFGAASGDEVVFGPNMTTLTFQLSRVLARTWQRGDVVVVTDSDHDANVTPWVLAARDAGAEVRVVPVRGDGTLDLAAYERLLSPRCKLVAVGAASNLTGTIHDVAAIARAAHRHGALVFVDAVHFAAHCRMDVAAWDCDFAVCSAYKFFGPHLGALWGRAALLGSLEAYKVRPAAAHGPEKWQTGTACFEAIAGALAAIDYLAQVGRDQGGSDTEDCDTGDWDTGDWGNRRACLDVAFRAIGAHERTLCGRLLDALQPLPLRIVGITDRTRLRERCATVSFVPARETPSQLCAALAERGIFTWAGNSYAVALTQALGLEPDGVLRAGLLHYHTAAEVDRFAAALAARFACAPTPNP